MTTINLIRGDDTDIHVTLITGGELSAPLISRADLHAKAHGKRILALSSTDGGISITDEGLVLHFDRTTTQGATWQQAEYDLQLLISDKVQTVLRGTIMLTHDITEVQLE